MVSALPGVFGQRAVGYQIDNPDGRGDPVLEDFQLAHTHADGQGYLIAVYMDQMVQVFCEYGVNASVQETADQKKDLSL